MSPGPSAVRVAVLYPELLGTYGDGGNAAVLAARARARGLSVEVVEVVGSEPLPTCDVYLLGGGEDGPQRHVARILAERDRMARAVEAGGAVLAVCAGMQILGSAFRDVDGPVAGLGLLPCRTVEPLPAERRAVGEVVARPDPALDLDLLLGFENHGGRTALDDGATPLGRVLRGTGNGVGEDSVDGVLEGRVVGTYLHGPVLALNPSLADRLLGWAVTSRAAGAPGDEVAETELPAGDERLAALDAAALAARAVRLRMAGMAAGSRDAAGRA